MVSYREAIAIAQVCFYVPAVMGGIFLALRHGFAKSSGWVLLITFSLLRLIGAILEIVGLNHPNRHVITGAIVCISIGLSPLTLMCLGLMSRINDCLGQPVPNPIYRGINLAGTVALILGIYGGTKQADSNTSDYTHVNSYSKAAAILFTLVYIVTVLMFFFLVTRLAHVPHGEKRLLLAVGLALPLLAVRYIYALIADFAQNTNFNSFFGNPTIYLVMAVLVEIIVLSICELVGFTLNVLPKGRPLNISETEMPSGHMPVRSRDVSLEEENYTSRDRLAGPKRQRKRQPRGPISWLYYQAEDSFRSHR